MLKLLKSLKHKEPHETCATFIVVNNWLILTVLYYKMPYYLQVLALIFIGLPLVYLIYYLLLKIFKNKGVYRGLPLNWKNFKNNTFSQNLAICKQSAKNKIIWSSMVANGISFVIALSLCVSVASLFSQYSIWLFLLTIDILQIAMTFLLFDLFTKKFNIIP